MAELRQKIYSKNRMMMANVISGMAIGGFTGYFVTNASSVLTIVCLGAALGILVHLSIVPKFWWYRFRSIKENIMKRVVLLTTLIVLLSCGSDSNLISPDPSVDTSQPAEKNEMSVVENPLVVPPEVMVEPPNEGPPPIRVVVPPEDIEIIVELPEGDPPLVRVVVPPKVIKVMAEPPNEDQPPVRVIIVVRPEVPEVIVEPPNEDQPMEE